MITNKTYLMITNDNKQNIPNETYLMITNKTYLMKHT